MAEYFHLLTDNTRIPLAVINGRKFIGIDSEEKYLDLSVKRYKGLGSEDKRKK
jgi:DNA modification methylase